MHEREARARLAAAQAEVVRALVADGPVPPGFDSAHIALARQVLRDKQAHIAHRRALAAARATQRATPWATDVRRPLWRRVLARLAWKTR